MLQLDSQGLQLLYEQQRDNYDPLERRLAYEHLRVAALCENDPGSDGFRIDYKVADKDILPPRNYRITYSGLTSIVDVDADMLPIFHDTHVVEIRLTSGFPVEAPICYMVTPAWHPNIQSDPGHYQGRICGNTEGFGVYFSLDELILRIRAMLSYEVYHAEVRYPYPEDENVARWVREYAEPLGWVTAGIGINADKTLPENWKDMVRTEQKMKIKML